MGENLDVLRFGPHCGPALIVQAVTMGENWKREEKKKSCCQATEFLRVGDLFQPSHSPDKAAKPRAGK
jgi:hypothetical protein